MKRFPAVYNRSRGNKMFRRPLVVDKSRTNEEGARLYRRIIISRDCDSVALCFEMARTFQDHSPGPRLRWGLTLDHVLPWQRIRLGTCARSSIKEN